MSTVDEFIARCDDVIADHKGMTARDFYDLSREIVVAFNPFIDNISHYRAGRSAEAYSVRDIKELRGKLAVYRDGRNHELEIARLNAAAAGVNVAVDNVNHNVASANAAATVVSISQAFDALESCSLSPEELSEMKAAIADLEVAKGKDPETVCEKASKLLDLAKKGADTAKAVAPFVAAALSALVGL